MRAPSRLVSLADMLRVHAHQYIALGRAMNYSSLNLILSDTDAAALSDEERSDLLEHLKELRRHCDQLGLDVASRGITRALTDLPQTHRELELIYAPVDDELETRLFLYVPAHHAKYFEQDDVVGKGFFPLAQSEFRRAGNCHATTEFTASVFHSMRAVEYGFKAIYPYLGLRMPDKKDRSWGNLASGLRDEITKRTKAPNTWTEDALFKSILERFVSFKDSVRNETMHPEGDYSEYESARVFAASKDFIEKLSQTMKEDGSPA